MTVNRLTQGFTPAERKQLANSILESCVETHHHRHIIISAAHVATGLDVEYLKGGLDRFRLNDEGAQRFLDYLFDFLLPDEIERILSWFESEKSKDSLPIKITAKVEVADPSVRAHHISKMMYAVQDCFSNQQLSETDFFSFKVDSDESVLEACQRFNPSIVGFDFGELHVLYTEANHEAGVFREGRITLTPHGIAQSNVLEHTRSSAFLSGSFADKTEFKNDVLKRLPLKLESIFGEPCESFLLAPQTYTCAVDVGDTRLVLYIPACLNALDDDNAFQKLVTEFQMKKSPKNL